MYFKIPSLFIVISFMFFSACNQGHSKSSDDNKTSITENIEKIKNLEKTALSSNKITDTVLLDYRFGMTKEQITIHTEKLFRDKKLKKNYDGKYYFEIASKFGENYKGYVFAEYYEKKTFSIGLVFSEELNSTLVFHALSDIYEEKYGKSDFMDKPFSDMDLYERYWFKNNLKISMKSGVPNTNVSYIDLRFERKKEIADSTIKAIEANNLKNKL